MSVGELRQGERVDTEFGQRKIASITAQAYRGVLYNFETTEHVYRIGTIGTLVHNNYPKEIFASDKLDYLFGQVTSSAHNEARSIENLAQMRRIGLWNDAGGREFVRNHLTESAREGSNIATRFTTEHGEYLTNMDGSS